MLIEFYEFAASNKWIRMAFVATTGVFVSWFFIKMLWLKVG